MSLSVISSPYHNAVHNANFVHITECQTEITLADDRIFTINWAFMGQEDSESWWKKIYIYIYHKVSTVELQNGYLVWEEI